MKMKYLMTILTAIIIIALIVIGVCYSYKTGFREGFVKGTLKMHDMIMEKEKQDEKETLLLQIS